MPDEAARARVLLVDDDEDDWLITRGLFDEMERGLFSLEWARDYHAGLAMLRERRHDVVLCDYQLGAHTGLDLLREARAEGVHAPIIVLTGQGDRETDLRAMEAGAEDFLDKGKLTAALLERAIRYAIGRHRAEEHVRVLQEIETQLQAAVRARDEFLSIASHELKTPLTPLLLHIDSLRRALQRGEPIEPAVFEQRLEMAWRQLKRLHVLMNDLLDVSRIAGGRLRLHPEEMDLSQLAREICQRFRPQAEAAGCALECHAGSELRGQWDPLRLDQVLSNLLSNAIKYGRGAPIDVEVSGGASTARLSVRDHGIGIAKDELSRIFGRFERAVSPRNYGGLGLGLYIAREIVESHGGNIVAQSQPGEGATFQVILPRVVASERDAGAPATQ